MIVQYIFLVSDIPKIKKGALIAQACHASIKAINIYKDVQDTKDYLSSIDNMTTIILKIKSSDIEIIQKHLTSLDLIVWIEQPENIITCLALRPYDTNKLTNYLPFLKNYKLF